MDEQPQQLAPTQSAGSALNILERAFLSADDAARYAHERIGRHRNRGYYGYILQRNDQRFVLTDLTGHPVSMTSHHKVIPDKHVLHSRFYSHPALSTLDVAKVTQLKWTVEDAATSLLMFSVDELRNSLQSGLPAYLSGAENSLIGFTPDRSRTASLVAKLGTEAAPGVFALGMKTGAIKPEQFVEEAAAAGDLQVLVSNGRWRPRGRITGPVVAGPWERSVPERVSFGAVSRSADEAALERYAKDTELHDEERTWFGFILKQQGKEEYIATELVPVSDGRDKLYSLRSLFGISRKAGDYDYPESFKLHAFYYSRQRVKHARDPARRWLAHHFIVPRDLFVVVYDSNKRPVLDPDRVIPLYVSTQDGALLKYVPRKGTKLFDNDTPGMGLEEIQKNLASGVLTPTGFVRVVANSGVLQVMRTNVCWDSKGVVDKHWQSSMNLQRRTLGPVFLTADDAALHARSQIPSGSAKAFGGVILKRADGFFVATDPIAILREDFDIPWVFPDEAVTLGQFPAGCSVVARYRSRVPRELPVLLSKVDKEVYLNMLSADVAYTAFTREGQTFDEYFLAPDGATIRYRAGLWARFKADLAIALGTSGKPGRELDAASIKEQIYRGLLSPTNWVKSLAKSGYLQVVSGSPLWGPARTVTEFEAYPPAAAVTSGYARAVAEPACSPMYLREQDAACFAHERARNRSATGFGFILKNTRTGVFIATLPIDVQGTWLAYERIFPGVLPSSHVSSAIHLCAGQAPQKLSDDDYRHFLSPVDVSLARDAARTPHGFRPIYFSCADGALLRLLLSPFDPDLSRDKFGQYEFKDNPFAALEHAQRDWKDIGEGRFRLSSYIQRMAKSGELEVLVTSAYWSQKGKVSQNWRPRMPSVSVDEQWANSPAPALGPIFHHPDDAALYAQSRLGSHESQTTVHASGILSSPGTNSFVALEPIADPGYPNEAIKRIFRIASDPLTSPRNKPPRFPDGYTLVAGHQLFQVAGSTLAERSDATDANFASPAQVHAYTHALKAKGFDINAYYYSTRFGALLKYTPTYSASERTLLLTQPVQLVEGKWATVLSTDVFITRLADIGNLQVLKPAYFWNQARRLGSDWSLRRQQVQDIFPHPTRDEL